MKENIKKDLKREILKRFYIDDNTLLEYEIENSEVVFNIRFIENRSIHEHVLGRVDIAEFANHLNRIIRLNEDCSAIAFYQKNGNRYQLSRLYDTKEHAFALDDFMREEYLKKFGQKKLTKRK